jgi:hypothetical protein
MFTSTWTWAKELSDTDDTGDFELDTTIEDSYSRSRDRGARYSPLAAQPGWSQSRVAAAAAVGPALDSRLARDMA